MKTMGAPGGKTAILTIFLLTANQGDAIGADRNACRQFAKQDWSKDETVLWQELCNQAKSGIEADIGQRQQLNIGKRFLKGLFTSKEANEFLPSGTIVVRKAEI
jgi:hypothetical protein